MQYWVSTDLGGKRARKELFLLLVALRQTCGGAGIAFQYILTSPTAFFFLFFFFFFGGMVYKCIDMHISFVVREIVYSIIKKKIPAFHSCLLRFFFRGEGDSDFKKFIDNASIPLGFGWMEGETEQVVQCSEVKRSKAKQKRKRKPLVFLARIN